ncbi:shikimate kinase [Nafulsella turpanensis]|uniref:shikimate kinase n=1 Tax=Nafulsella turpanensis TaxID=1265690 RepID=UPI00034C003E|nr:shikimate kinase [Nafulsella turpanensis]
MTLKPAHIVLVGMPGSGKSTLGKILARELHLPFLDLDSRIEEREGQSVPAIFGEKGEEYFRKVERECLQEVLDWPEAVVLASGGGAPCFFDNMELIRKQSVSVYLKVSFPELAERLLTEGAEKRPLLQGYTETEKLAIFLEEKFAYRLPFYKKANLHFHNHAQADVQELVGKIQAGRHKQKF